MQTHDRRPRIRIRQRHEDHPVEPARPPQCDVDIPRCIRGTENVDTVIARRGRIHLLQQRVHHRTQPGTAAESRATMPQGVDLVEEQHARRLTTCSVEHRADRTFALAEPPTEHVGDAHLIEVRAKLARHGLRDVGLAASGRTVEQQAATGRHLEGLHQFGIADGPEQRQLELPLHIGHPSDVRQAHTAGPHGVEIVFIDHLRRLFDERGLDDIGNLLLGCRPVEPLGTGCRRQRCAACL